MVENDSGKISSFGEKSMINITDQKRGKLYIKDDCILIDNDSDHHQGHLSIAGICGIFIVLKFLKTLFQFYKMITNITAIKSSFQVQAGETL